MSYKLLDQLITILFEKEPRLHPVCKYIKYRISALMVWKRLCFEALFFLQRITELKSFNDKSVCRTAPATPTFIWLIRQGQISPLPQ